MQLKGKEFVEHNSGIFVSRDGEVFVNIKCRRFPNGHYTYGNTNSRGYKRVQYNEKRYLIHRLVAETFLDNPNNYSTVDHIDRNKENNNVENLRWADMSVQIQNRDTSKFKNNAKSKPVSQYTLDGKFVREWPSTHECGRNGFNQGHVSSCCNGKRKQYKDFKWKYSDEIEI